MAVVFAKVARIDYPKAWPSLFTDLLQQMQSQNTLVVRRVYLVLHHALKELASKRLSSDQKAFAEVRRSSLAYFTFVLAIKPAAPASYSLCAFSMTFLSKQVASVRTTMLAEKRHYARDWFSIAQKQMKPKYVTGFL